MSEAVGGQRQHLGFSWLFQAQTAWWAGMTVGQGARRYCAVESSHLSRSWHLRHWSSFRAWQCSVGTAACSLGLLSAPPLCGSAYLLCLVHDAQLNGVQTLQSPQAEMWDALDFHHLSLLTLKHSDLRKVSLPACNPRAALSRFLRSARAQMGEPSACAPGLLARFEQTFYIAGEVLCLQCFCL